MSTTRWLEAALAGLVLTGVYFFGLRHFGIGYGGGLATLILTVPALGWLYALLRFTRRDADDHWVGFGRRYHPIELYHVLWPGLFGAIAFFAVTLWFKEPGQRLVHFVGWLFPVLGIATFWSFRHDRQHRA
jgi:hypothetical protein